MNANLTPRQEAFAQHYALHGNVTAALSAAGYATQRAKPATVHRRPIEVLQNPKVTVRIDELREHVKDRGENVCDISADRILQEPGLVRNVVRQATGGWQGAARRS